MKNECKLCGGHLVLLGGLGVMNWYRCRSCGMEFSRRVPMKSLKAKHAGYLSVIVLLLLCAFTGYAQDADAEPKKLTNLRAQKDKMVKEATTPILRKYLTALDELKTELGGKGDAAGATAVLKEIDDLKQQIEDDARESAEKRSELTDTNSKGKPSNKKSPPSPAKDYNKHHYFFYMDKGISCSQAQENCVKAGGHLVIVNDAKEFEFLRVLIEKKGTKKEPFPHFWMGIQKNQKTQAYEWVDGSPITFDGWIVSNRRGVGVDYARMGNQNQTPECLSGFGWRPTFDNDAMVVGYLCEWDY